MSVPVQDGALPKPREVFSRIGFALLAVVGVSTVLQIVALTAFMVLERQGIGWIHTSWAMWAYTFVPVYVFAIPIGVWLMRRVPAKVPVPAKLGWKNFAILLLICFPVMYGGNLLGNLISALLSGGAAENGLNSYALDDSPLKFLVMVILAPLLEEMVFRKQLLDRCSRYGEKAAALFSALTFGLFHMNLLQFFYAFGLGWIFAYAYLRTGLLRYSVAMHMVVNFMGSVLAPWILSQVDLAELNNLNLQAMDDIALMQLLPGIALITGYFVLLLGLVIVGTVLLVIKSRQLVFLPAEEELPKPHRIHTIYGNAGCLSFILFCTVLCAINLL